MLIAVKSFYDGSKRRSGSAAAPAGNLQFSSGAGSGPGVHALVDFVKR